LILSTPTDQPLSPCLKEIDVRPLRYRNLLFSLAFCTLGTQSADAANFSFTGNFTHDNDVQLLQFSIASATSVTLNTLSFAGGTNAAGTPIAGGGFTPYLALFDGTGNMLNQTTGKQPCGGGNPAAPDAATGACWDEYFLYDLAHLGVLPAGSYTLALTEWDNVALGTTLADGFIYDSGPADFTGGPFLENSIGFGVQRDGHWAVDILAVDSASAVAVPEPDTLPLALAGLAGFVPFVRRRSALQG
jgi:hypothetical protein